MVDHYLAESSLCFSAFLLEICCLYYFLLGFFINMTLKSAGKWWVRKEALALLFFFRAKPYSYWFCSPIKPHYNCASDVFLCRQPLTSRKIKHKLAPGSKAKHHVFPYKHIKHVSGWIFLWNVLAPAFVSILQVMLYYVCYFLLLLGILFYCAQAIITTVLIILILCFLQQMQPVNKTHSVFQP